MLMWRLRKMSIMPTVPQNMFLLRKILIVGIPKSTALVIIFRAFMWLLSLRNEGPIIIIHLQCFEMVPKKMQDHLIKAWWTMELIFHPLILQWHPRKRKISMQRLKTKWKLIVYLPKKRTRYCLSICEKTCLCTKAIKDHAQKLSVQIISPATWVWNGSLWYPWWLQFFWNRILWSHYLPLLTY